MNYFKASTKDILKAIKEVSISIDDRSGDLKLTNIRIEAIGENKVKFSGTNLSSAARSTIKSENFSNSEIYVSNLLFLEVLKSADSEFLNFEIEDSKMKIIGYKEKFSIYCMVQDDSPIKFEDERIDKFISRSESIKINSIDIQEIIKRLKISISKEAREALHNIYMKVNNGKLEIVASDSRRISIAYLENFDREIEIGIINFNDLNKLLRLIGKKNIDIELLISDNHVIYKVNEFYLLSKKINKPFIPYERLIPTETGENSLIDIKEFLKILKKIKFIACENSYTVYLKFENQKLFIKTRSRSGEVVKEMDIKSNSNIIMGFNLLFLVDHLKNLKSREFNINFFHPEKQVVITEPENNFNFEFKYIVMPVRLRKGEF